MLQNPQNQILKEILLVAFNLLSTQSKQEILQLAKCVYYSFHTTSSDFSIIIHVSPLFCFTVRLLTAVANKVNGNGNVEHRWRCNKRDTYIRFVFDGKSTCVLVDSLISFVSLIDHNLIWFARMSCVFKKWRCNKRGTDIRFVFHGKCQHVT